MGNVGEYATATLEFVTEPSDTTFSIRAFRSAFVEAAARQRAWTDKTRDDVIIQFR
jgi:hypothetical protein